MRILSIDPSTKVFSLAVLNHGKVLRYCNIRLKKVLSESIIPAIDEILKKSKLTLRQLDGFAIGLGPGSFTSLRVGLATLKGLNFVLGKPVVGVSSLDLIARNVTASDVCVINDARRNQVYACFYEQKNGKLKRCSEHLLQPIEQVLEGCQGEMAFVGDAVPLYQKEILHQAKIQGYEPTLTPEKLWYPQAKNIWPLVEGRFKNKQFDDIDKLLPLYLYAADCQVRRT